MAKSYTSKTSDFKGEGQSQKCAKSMQKRGLAHIKKLSKKSKKPNVVILNPSTNSGQAM